MKIPSSQRENRSGHYCFMEFARRLDERSDVTRDESPRDDD